MPVKIGSIIRNIPYIKLITYSSQIRKHNITYNELILDAETKDSYAVRQGSSGRYCIYYNDIDRNIVNSNRVRWNLAHELGHVILKHHEMTGLEKLYRDGLDDETYSYFEEEANYFAQLILVPHSPLLGFNIQASNHIKILCKISGPASRKRFFEFMEWKKHVDENDEYDKRIFYYYFNFVFKRECKNCGIGIIQRYGKYCPICGDKNTLQWGDGDKMKYPLLETYETGKLKECPICKNEETDINGDYCQICGSYIVNRCTNEECNNTKILPSNARFCPICGDNSVFYNVGLLKSWNHDEINVQKNSYFLIPEGIDEELPFN